MSATEPVRFAYWVPDVSGGLVTSTIEQRTDWGYDYNRELAVLAENNGFDYALSQVRYMASYGAEFQHESTSFSLALLLATQRLKVIAAVHPGLWHPGVLAKLGAVEGFGAAVKQAGQSAADGEGMWQDSRFEDLIQYNDGFRTGLIGSPEQIAERIVAYKRLGVDLLLLGFLHYHEEVEYFGRRVLPLVRELEAGLPDTAPASVSAHV